MLICAKQLRALACALFGVMLAVGLCGCSAAQNQEQEQQTEETLEVNDVQSTEEQSAETSDDDSDDKADKKSEKKKEAEKKASKDSEQSADADSLYAKLDISKDERKIFQHGTKTAKYQKYIVLHDTENNASASSVLDYWESDGKYIAAHFIINKDGSILQCVPLDKIAHHAGYGDTGHNKKYKVTDESRDDMKGTTSIGSDFADYGMNSYSVGIEMVHVGGSGSYPKAQLKALDNLIAYIDAYYGFESTIIDHKMWRSGNSDTSSEFATYLKNYKDHRSYK